MSLLSFEVYADYSKVQKLQSEISKLENQLASFKPGTSISTIRSLESQLASARKEFVLLTTGAAQAGAAIEMNIKRGVNGAIGALNDLTQKVQNPVIALAQVAGVAGLGSFLSSVQRIRSQFQLMETNINTILGSVEKGKTMMAQLTEYAAESPLDFQGTVRAAQTMLGFGIEQKKILPYMRALGDVSMGSASKFNSLTLAFSQMSAAGKLMGQDLNQMINQGFNPLHIIAEKTGKSIGVLKEEMSKGKITSEMVQQAFIDATSAGGKFYGMSANATKTINGQMSMLGDNIDLMYNEIGQASEETIIKAIDGATRLVGHWKEVGMVLGTATAAFGVFKASVMAKDFIDKANRESEVEAIVKGYNAELAKLKEIEIKRREMQYEGDIASALKSGAIDENMAKALTQARDAQIKEVDTMRDQLDKSIESMGDTLGKKVEKMADIKGKIDEVTDDKLKESLQQQYDKEMAAYNQLAQQQKVLAAKSADLTDLYDQWLQEQSSFQGATGTQSNPSAPIPENDRMETELKVAEKRAQIAKEQHDLSVQKIKDANDKINVADELYQKAIESGDKEKENAAAERLSNAIDDKKIATKQEAAAATALHTAETEVNTIKEQINMAATVQDTTATQVNTGAKQANTGATVGNTAATAKATLGQKLHTAATALGTRIAKAAAGAWNSLTAAIAANPWGLAITALTTIIGLLWTFFSSSEETSEAVERFGESAVKTKNNLDTLYAVMENTAKDSKVHKDAVEELAKTAKDYGYVLDNEIDKESKLLEIKKKLIEAIIREGEERQIANNIASFQTKMDDDNKDYKDQLVKDLKDANDGMTDAEAEAIANTILEQMMQQRAAVAKQIADIEALEDRIESYKNDHKNDKINLSASNQETALDVMKKQKKQLEDGLAKMISERGKSVAAQLGYKNLDLGDDFSKNASQQAKDIKNITNALNAYIDARKKVTEQKDANMGPGEEKDYTKMDIKKLMTEFDKVMGQIDTVNSTPVKPQADVTPLSDIFAAAEKAAKGVKDVDDSKAQPKTDNTEVEDTTDKAQKSVDKMRELDSSVATPLVDTKYLSIALEQLGEIRFILRDINGNPLNTNLTERKNLHYLTQKYGAGFTLEDITDEADKKLFSNISQSARERSRMTIEGKTYMLDQQQSATYQYLMDTYGKDMKAENMTVSDKLLFNSLNFDILSTAYENSKGKQQEFDNMKKGIEAQIKNAKTTDDFSTLRSSLSSQLKKTPQNSKEYAWIESKIKQIDRLDKSKQKPGEAQQREYERKKAEKQEKERQEENIQQEKQRQRDLEIMQLEGSEKEIATAHNEATKKTNALIKDRKKEADRLKEFDRQQWLKGGKDRKAYQWQQSTSDEEYMRRAGENVGFDTRTKQIATEKSQALDKVYRKDFQAMNEYLKQYGSFEQRRLAITQEYAEKIAHAENEGTRMQLEHQRDTDLENLETEAITRQIDWYSLFEGFGGIMSSQLEPIYQRLQEYVKTDAFRKSGADNQKTVVEAMNKLRKQLGKNQGWKDLAAAMTEYQTALQELTAATEEDVRISKELAGYQLAAQTAADNLKNLPTDATEEQRKKAEEEAAKTNKELADYLKISNKAAERRKNAESNVQTAQQNVSNTAENVQNKQTEIGNFIKNAGLGQIGEVFDSFMELISAIDMFKAWKASKDGKPGENEQNGSQNTAEAGENAGGLTKEDGKEIGDNISSSVGDSLGEAFEKAGLIGKIIAAVIKILNLLKDGIGKIVADFLDTVFNAISGILDNILSGKLFVQIGESLYGGIMKVIKSITTLGGSLDWWSNGESDRNLEKDIERLTNTNEALRRSVDELADVMNKSAVANASDIYQTQKANIEQSMANTQEMMSRSGAAYKKGIKGKHSSNVKIANQMSAEDWSRISKAAGVSVRSASQFWALTSEQMAKVARDTPDLYAKIKQYADNGYKDAAQYMDEYIDYYKQLEELEDAYRERLTDVSLDSVQDEFKSLLLDMESDTQAFTDNFERMMQQAVVNSLMSSKYNDMIKEWYKEFAAAMEDGTLTEAEQRRSKAAWDDIVDQAVTERNQLKRAMGWDESATQSATGRTLSGMSTDQANALEGRITAIQIAVESIRANNSMSYVSLTQLNDSLLQIMQSYNRFSVRYDGIEQQIAKIYVELLTISENTGAIVKPIQSMQSDISEIKKNVKGL